MHSPSDRPNIAWNWKQSLEVFVMLLYFLLVLTMSDAWRRPHDPLRPHLLHHLHHHHHHLHHHHHHLLQHHFHLLHHSNPQTHNSIQRWELWKMCQLCCDFLSWYLKRSEYRRLRAWVHASISDNIHLKIHSWQVVWQVLGNQWDYQSFVWCCVRNQTVFFLRSFYG